jgi:hypothetical protein
MAVVGHVYFTSIVFISCSFCNCTKRASTCRHTERQHPTVRQRGKYNLEIFKNGHSKPTSLPLVIKTNYFILLHGTCRNTDHGTRLCKHNRALFICYKLFQVVSVVIYIKFCVILFINHLNAMHDLYRFEVQFWSGSFRFWRR